MKWWPQMNIFYDYWLKIVIWLQETFLDKLTKEVPVYRLLGHLNQIIELDQTNVDSLLDSAAAHTEDCVHLNKSKCVSHVN